MVFGAGGNLFDFVVLIYYYFSAIVNRFTTLYVMLRSLKIQELENRVIFEACRKVALQKLVE